MKRLFWFSFLINIPLSNTKANYNIYSNNGWIPIVPNNHDKYQTIRHMTTFRSVTPEQPKQNIAKIFPKPDVIRVVTPNNKLRDALTSVRDNKDNMQINISDSKQICVQGIDCFYNKVKNEEARNVNRNDKDMKIITDLNKQEINNKLIYHKGTRNGKEIFMDTYNNKLVNEQDFTYTNEDQMILSEQKQHSNIIKDSSNTYEVTEPIEPIYELNTESSDIKQLEYMYDPSQFGKANLSSTLWNILSKYNIKVDDRLSNYALSKRNKGLNDFQSRFVHNYPIQLRTSYGYNNANHLPADPILAVFLSNYGYYLPGLYGLKGNYNNLYGYLASNNIHNNKPFGLYKIYSDTDSFN